VRIYADTSFLVSLLYVHDAGHAAARAAFVGQPGAEWLTSEWSQFETFNTLRQLSLCNPGPAAAIPEALRRYFRACPQSG